MASLPLTQELKSKISKQVHDLMSRRLLIDASFPISSLQLRDLSFERIFDQKLMDDYERRFPRQIISPSTIRLTYNYPVQNGNLEWTLTFMVPGVRFEDTGGRFPTLYRERSPQAFDDMHEWLETHRQRVLERQIAIYLTNEAMNACNTTSQLQWIWPTLLYLDRSGKREKLDERSRPRFKVPVGGWRTSWYEKINEWVGLATVMPALSEFCDNVPLLGSGSKRGSFSIDIDSVHQSVIKNLKPLHIDPDGKIMPPMDK